MFGAGEDGVATFNGGGVTGASYSDPNYTLTQDVYYSEATLSGNKNIDTAGFRIFVKGTFTISSGSTIKNNGSVGGTGSGTTGGGAGGAGGGQSGTLSPGTDGVNGGDGGGLVGSPSGTSAEGRKGGGGGGSGGIIFISARIFSNSGTIESIGGAGGSGANAAIAN